MTFRPGLLLLFAAALLLPVGTPGQNASPRESPGPRFRYAPVQTQRFDLDLTVKAQFSIAGEERTNECRLRGSVRLIPFKNEKNGRMHLMLLLEEGTLARLNDGEKDTVDMTPWFTKRIELVIDPQGAVKQSLEIEHLPELPIPGLARGEENGLKTLLSTLFPHLPSGAVKASGTSISAEDSLRMKYPDKSVVRKWKETGSWKTAARADTIARYSYQSHLVATELIFPQKAASAELSEDIVTIGTCGISATGKLAMHEKNSTIYRSIRSRDPKEPGSIEETTTISLKLRRR